MAPVPAEASDRQAGDAPALPSAGIAAARARETGPSEDDIRQRAYQMYLDRGGDHGRDFDDWLRAEQELRRRP